MRTRTMIFGLAMTTVAMVGCSLAAGGSGGTLEGVTWSLTSFFADGSQNAVAEDAGIDATFQATDSVVSGSAGCNRYSGPYEADGSQLTFGALATTQMACDESTNALERTYLASLAAARTYTATAEALTIYDADAQIILVYAVAKPGELTGVTWHATGINNGTGGVVSVAPGTDPTAAFDPAGTVSGDAGCNQFNGPAVVDGTSIAIGPLASTKMACADPAASTQETAYLAALEAATTVQIQGSTLELRDADGALQVGFEAR
jgi:heat shock protein HslJ